MCWNEIIYRRAKNSLPHWKCINPKIVFALASHFIERLPSTDDRRQKWYLWQANIFHSNLPNYYTLMFPSRILFNQPLAFWRRIFFRASLFCAKLICTRAYYINFIRWRRQTSPNAPSRSARSRASWCWSATRPPTPPTSTSRGKSKTRTRPSRRTSRPRVSSAFSPSSRGAKISALTSASPTTRLACPSLAKETSQVSLISIAVILKICKN